MITSAYVHIPFCRRKCKYCSFISFSEIDKKEQYLDALNTEIKNRYKGEFLKTLYIGGGTPSLLQVCEIEKIINAFNFSENVEITCEANPEHLTLNWLKEIKNLGINRLSLGVQAFDDKLLDIIGRKHTVKDVFKAIKNARKAGFENINIDLIYGLPNQNMADFSASIITACELGVEHISSYGLKIEKGSFFYKNTPKNLPDEEIQADMYLKLCEIVQKYNYQHYEISNFAKKDFFSKHNLNYWNAKNYYGFGCAACGYEKNIRYSHKKTIEQYCKNPFLLIEKEEISKQMQLEENIFLGLRKSEGININKINKNFNIDFEEKYKSILLKYAVFFAKTKNGYKLTDQGFLLSNQILSEFID